MRAAVGLAPSDEPSSQDPPPQQPIDNNTFYGKMLSGLNAARVATKQYGFWNFVPPGPKQPAANPRTLLLLLLSGIAALFQLPET
jgi:hypothetical protein